VIIPYDKGDLSWIMEHDKKARRPELKKTVDLVDKLLVALLNVNVNKNRLL